MRVENTKKNIVSFHQYHLRYIPWLHRGSNCSQESCRVLLMQVVVVWCPLRHDETPCGSGKTTEDSTRVIDHSADVVH